MLVDLVVVEVCCVLFWEWYVWCEEVEVEVVEECVVFGLLVDLYIVFLEVKIKLMEGGVGSEELCVIEEIVEEVLEEYEEIID